MSTCADHVISYLFAQSWQIALLAGMVGLASWALRNRSAHLRYLLWLIVLAKCLVPPVWTVPLAVLPEESAHPSMTLVNLPEEYSTPETPMSNDATPKPIEPLLALPSTRELLALGWVVGVLLFLLWVGGRAVRYTVWLRARRRVLPPALRDSIQNSSAGFHFAKWPRIWLLEDISQPFVWGLGRGSVYLPADFAGADGADRQRSILAHEISHVARFDAGVNLLQILAQAVYWFHPFVWWANRKIRQEREKCCDEMAVAHLHTRPEHYTGAIVEALAAERRSAHPLPSLAIVGSVKDIEERIRTMLRPGKTFRPRPSLMAATVSLLIALVTIPTALVLTARGQAQPPAQSLAGEGLTPPRFAARTFNAKTPFEVLVQAAAPSGWKSIVGPQLSAAPPSQPKSVGHTPSAAALEIPACDMWLVRPSEAVQDWDLLVREIKQNEVPGLALGSATDSDLQHLADLTGLQRLELAGTQITDAGMASLEAMKELRQLNLSRTQITDAGLRHLKGLTRLRVLRLGGTKITDAGLEYLQALSELQLLELMGDAITDAGPVLLRALPSLRDLNLVDTKITDAGLDHIGDLTALQGLYLQSPAITDAGVAHLQGLTRLRSLFLIAQLTDAGMEHLKTLTGLQWLFLGSGALSEKGMACLKGLTGLQNLYLTGTTDAGLECLRGLTGLRGLYLLQTKVTDAGLEHLRGLTALEDLSFVNTGITDLGLERLQRLTGLRYLFLTGTQVTDAGVKRLQQALPNLTIGRDAGRSGTPSADKPAQPAGALTGPEFTDSFENGTSAHWRFADMKKEEGPTAGHAVENGQLMLANAKARLDNTDWTDYVARVRVCIKESVASGDAIVGIEARTSPSNFGLKTTDCYTLAILCQDNEPRGVVLGLAYYDASKTNRKDMMGVTPSALARDQWYTLEFEVRGQRLRGYLDGKLMVDATDARLSKGSVCLATWRTRALFDDFSIRQLP